MGTSLTVGSVGYNRGENRATIVADMRWVYSRQDTFALAPNIIKRWHDVFGAKSPLLPLLIKGLEAAFLNRYNYDKKGSPTTLDGIGTSFEVLAAPGVVVNYQRSDDNNTCDAVRVKMLDEAGKLFTLHIAIRDGVSRFVASALKTLNPNWKEPERSPAQPHIEGGAIAFGY